MSHSMMKIPAVALAAFLALAGAARSDELDGARAKLAEIRAQRSSREVAAAPAPAPAPAPAAAEPAPGKDAKDAGKGAAANAAPAKPVDPRVSTGPGRPALKLSGTLPYLGGPFARRKWRVVIEEHAYREHDLIHGARIERITAKDVTFSKDGDTWTLPANSN